MTEIRKVGGMVTARVQTPRVHMRVTLTGRVILTGLGVISWLSTACLTLAQSPKPVAAYISDGAGSWDPAPTTDTTGALPVPPQAVSVYCYNSTLSQWVPATSVCLGGSGPGSGGTVTSVSGLTPLFTVFDATTTPTFILSAAAANSVFGNFTGAITSPAFSAAPVFSAANLTNFPTFNQNTTGTAANVSGIVAVAHGGTGTATPSLTAGNLISLTGVWPAQTVAVAGAGTVACAVGNAAGSGATCSATGNNLSGTITVNTGTSPLGADTLVTLTFGTARLTAPAPCHIQSTNSSAAGNEGMVFTTTPTTTTWTIAEAISPPAASSTFTWGYICL